MEARTTPTVETEKPLYVLETVEACLAPVPQPVWVRILKKVVAAVLLVLVLGSLVFQDNLFLEMTTLSRVLLIGLVVFLFRTGAFREDWQPFPMELRFYKDYMVVHRPRHYYNRKLSRHITDRIRYEDIKKIVYERKYGRVFIHGDMHCTWYKLNRDGSMPEQPGFDKFVCATSVWFESRLEKETDIRSLLEHWTGKQCIVE